jgi:hypothetical protein
MSLLLVALVAVAAQAPVSAVRETASGISFTRPAGWVRQELDNQSVGFVPPGPDGDRFKVIVLPGRPSGGPHRSAHRDVFQSMTSGSRVQGRIQQKVVTGWLRSEAKVMTAEGQPLWTALYTVQPPGRLEAVMVVAADEPVYKLYRPAVDQLIAGATLGVGVPAGPAPLGAVASGAPAGAPPVTGAPAGAAPATAARGGTAIYGLVIPYPSTWTRQNDPAGAVVLIPPQMQGVQLYFLSVLPPTPKSGTHWQTHKELLAQVLKQVQWTDEPVTIDYPDGPGPFIRTGVAGHIASGAMQLIELYTAAHGDTVETVVGVNSLDRNVTDPVLRQVTFVDPRGLGERARIVEAYRRIDQRLYADIAGGAPIAGSLQYDRMWLREDGVVDFSTTYPEGYAASMLPYKVDVNLLNGDFGSWRAVGNQVRVVRRAGTPEMVFDRENGGLRSGGTWWEPMPRVDDLKLSGRWSIRSPANETVSPYYDWIEFTPDGRFSSSGVMKRISFGMVDRPKPPDPGSGTYRIRDWTIFFTFSDGSMWSTDFSTLGREAGNAAAVLFGTYVYPRER